MSRERGCFLSAVDELRKDVARVCSKGLWKRVVRVCSRRVVKRVVCVCSG